MNLVTATAPPSSLQMWAEAIDPPLIATSTDQGGIWMYRVSLDMAVELAKDCISDPDDREMLSMLTGAVEVLRAITSARDMDPWQRVMIRAWRECGARLN